MLNKVKPEEKKKMLDEIAQFFNEEYDLNLGIIASENIYDFFMDSLGKTIYNNALDEAKKFHRKRIDDMESDYYMLYEDVR